MGEPAAGTCGFGIEIVDVVDLEVLGGFVTKSVTVEPRWICVEIPNSMGEIV